MAMRNTCAPGLHVKLAAASLASETARSIVGCGLKMRAAPRLYALVLFLHAKMPFFGYSKDEDAVKDHSIQIGAGCA